MGNWIMNRVLPKLDSKQFGAIRGRFTTHALLICYIMWHKALDQSQLASAMFVEFAKAFDPVDHTVVINNLIELAIPGLVVKWFASFLSGRQQRVKIANNLSSWLILKGGMPRGSWLEPFTLIIVIDKLKLSRSTHKYIDDTTLTKILFPGQTSQMVGCMNELHQWSLADIMQINKQKTKEMVVTTSRTASLFHSSRILNGLKLSNC